MNLILPIYSFMLLTLLLIVYFSKKRINTDETKLYSVLLMLSVFNIIFNIIGIYLGYNNGDLSFLKVLNHFDLPLYFWWASVLFVYLLYVYWPSNKKYYRIKNFVFGINIIITLISFILPVEVIITESAGFAIGLCVNMVYFVCGIYLLSSLIIASLLIKKKNLRKAVPIFSLLVLGIIAALIQKNIPSLIIIPAVIVFVELIMYHTIENPDVKMVNELIENRRIIERTSEEKSVFLFKMSQGLREEVNNIDKQVDLYKEGNLNEEEKDLVIENIDKNNQKINYLINDVLGINSFDSSNIKKLENTYNIYTLLEDINKRGTQYKYEEVDYRFTIVDNMPKEVYGDSIKLKQVLMSVLINALENTKEGFVHVDVNSFTKYDICRIMITIEDSGTGISITDINNILDQDLELTEQDYLKIEKLDVDLPLAYKMIKMLGGTMYIKSEEDKGTEVIITIDQYIATNEEVKDNSKIDNYIKTRKRGNKILLVDDNEEEIRKIKRVLEQKDYDVVTSMFGQDAIDRIRNKEKYDVILIDDEMPLMNGINVLDELVKLKNKSKKIVLLEKDKLFIAHHYVEDGFNNYIDKSHLVKELDEKIK